MKRLFVILLILTLGFSMYAGAVVLEAEYRIPQLSAIPCRQYVSGRRWMLGQAVAGYRIFTGEEPCIEKMEKVL